MAREDVTVSIVCIAYNHAPYIKDALNGFLMQKTNFKYEILIHDDASTDKTADIIREYEKKYPEIIKPIYQAENQYSKRVGIIKTYINPIIRGKYVALCEGDDFWADENKLQMQVNFLESHPEYTACVHAHQEIDMRDNSIKEIHAFDCSGTVTTQQIIKGDGNLFATNSTVCKREAFLSRPPFKEISPVGDYAMMIQFALIGKVYYIDKAMSCYRYMIPGSWSDRNMLDVQRCKVHAEQMEKMLNEADRYNEYRYHEEFQYIIDKKWFRYFVSVKKPSFLKKHYKEHYVKLPFKNKLYLYLKSYAPFIINMRRKNGKK